MLFYLFICVKFFMKEEFIKNVRESSQSNFITLLKMIHEFKILFYTTSIPYYKVQIITSLGLRK